MIVNTFTIVFCIVIAVVCFISVLMNPFIRRIQLKHRLSDVPTEGAVSVSILVLSDDNAESLEAHLPILLSQNYSADYEIIVVMKQGDVATECVVNKYSSDSKLKTTFIPSKSLFMSARKLAVTLGVKAAKYEWIVLLDAESTPLSDHWLATLARSFNDSADIVMGYSNYALETRARHRFIRLRTAYYLMHQAVKGTAYRCNGTNLAFRRDMFINGEGYKGNLQYVNGEYDFIVNKYATPLRTKIETSNDASVREDTPSKKALRNNELAYLHLRHSMLHGRWMRFIFNTDMIFLWSNCIIILLAMVIAVLVQNWILLITAVLSMLTTLWLRVYAACKAVKTFDEHIPKWKIPFLELFITFHNVCNMIRYVQADKRDFSTHKL